MPKPKADKPKADDLLVQNYGLYWKPEDVNWGRQKNSGTLTGYRNNKDKNGIDFRKQIGIYILYCDYKLVYVGQTGSGDENCLFDRLRTHHNGALKGRWNQFSWFGLKRVVGSGSKQKLSMPKTAFHPKRNVVLDHIEAILLYAVEPNSNKQGGKWLGAKKYFQRKTQKEAKPPWEKKLDEIYEFMKKVNHKK